MGNNSGRILQNSELLDSIVRSRCTICLRILRNLTNLKFIFLTFPPPTLIYLNLKLFFCQLPQNTWTNSLTSFLPSIPKTTIRISHTRVTSTWYFYFPFPSQQFRYQALLHYHPSLLPRIHLLKISSATN